MISSKGTGSTSRACSTTNFGPTSDVSNFVQVAQAGNDITVAVDPNGGGNFANGQTFVLAGYGTSGADIVRLVFEASDHQVAV